MISGGPHCLERIVLFPLQQYKVGDIQMPHLLDVQNVFPKRVGIMNGNTLVVQYYDLGRDKFKKHPIPFNPLEEVKSIIDQIYKNIRHIPFLKKVDPKHLKAVLEGQSVAPKKEQVQQEKKPNFQKFAEILTKNEQKKWRQEKLQESIDKSNILSISQASNKGAIGKARAQQVDDYYGEQFQQFEISQSMDKQKSISISNIQKSKPSVSQNSSSSKSKAEPQSSSLSKPKSQVDSSSFSKAKESEVKVIEQSIEEQYADDFEFVEEPKEQKKKEKKEKKEKSKSKQKKPKKQKKEKAAKVQAKQVQEQFQFL